MEGVGHRLIVSTGWKNKEGDVIRDDVTGDMNRSVISRC
jgi:hypothetical protein